MRFYSTCCGDNYIPHTEYIGKPNSIPILSYEAGAYRYCYAMCQKCGHVCNLSTTKNKVIRFIKIQIKKIL